MRLALISTRIGTSASGELQLMQPGVQAAQLEKLGMRPKFHHLAVVEDQDARRVLNRR